MRHFVTLLSAQCVTEGERREEEHASIDDYWDMVSVLEASMRCMGLSHWACPLYFIPLCYSPVLLPVLPAMVHSNHLLKDCVNFHPSSTNLCTVNLRTTYHVLFMCQRRINGKTTRLKKKSRGLGDVWGKKQLSLFFFFFFSKD